MDPDLDLELDPDRPPEPVTRAAISFHTRGLLCANVSMS
jgi:hypothetical protein